MVVHGSRNGVICLASNNENFLHFCIMSISKTDEIRQKNLQKFILDLYSNDEVGMRRSVPSCHLIIIIIIINIIMLCTFVAH